MACWAACWAAVPVLVAAEALSAQAAPPADIAWVWDHQAAPLRAGAWAVTVGHLQLTPDGVIARPRLRALPPAGARPVTPVVHVEQVAGRPSAPLTEAQSDAIAARVLDVAGRSTSGWVQLDFEARPAQRDGYHALVRRLRSDLPASMRLSVTLLAWQCRSAAWIEPLAADELVPMFFRLGRDAPAWLAQARRGGPQLHPRCRHAAGFAPQTTPPEDWQRQWPRRYWFNLTPGRATTWPDDVEQRVWPTRPHDPALSRPSESPDPSPAPHPSREH